MCRQVSYGALLPEYWDSSGRERVTSALVTAVILGPLVLDSDDFTFIFLLKALTFLVTYLPLNPLRITIISYKMVSQQICNLLPFCYLLTLSYSSVF